MLELKDRGYQGGPAVVRRFVRKIRGARSRKAYLRIETEPGEQAQVDWGSFGQMRIGGTTRPLSCFAMVLSWSRAIFVDFALDQRLDTFLRMHERAFVLKPLTDVAPAVTIPGRGLARAHLARVRDQRVRRTRTARNAC